MYSWAILLRYHAAFDFVDEFKAFAWLIRLKAYPNIAVLAAAAGLFGVFALNLGGTFDGFAEGNLRFADISFNIELSLHAVN